MISNVRALFFDSNIWVALTFSAHPFHLSATSVLESCSETKAAVCCRATELSFLRLITTTALTQAYGFPNLSNRQATGILADFLQLPYVNFQDEPPATHELWLRLADRSTGSPKLWMDAYLAAFAISGSLRFVTTDKDFRQFQSIGLDLHLLEP